MDLKELGEYLFPDIRILLRVETLRFYDSASDQPHFDRWRQGLPPQRDEGWAAWLERIRRDTAAGISWQRLHVVAEPLSEHNRFELGVQYVANAEAGEDIRILVVDHERLAELRDFFVVNAERVAVSTYDAQGKFVTARAMTETAPAWVASAREMWDQAEPFTKWWAAHPEYHQSQRAA
jgi:hypothetical protein